MCATAACCPPAPNPAKGYWQAPQDLRIERAFVVAPVPGRYPLAPGVQVIPAWEIAQALGDVWAT